MKEKTFEELTKPYRYYGANSLEELIIKENVLKLMQQVREATIAECEDIASRIDDAFVYEAINKLPTDRILTDK